MGSPGQLVINGELDQVYPAEDMTILNAANPIEGDKHVYKTDANEAREDFMVKTMMEHEGIAVIVLGGNHDFKNNVERLGAGKVELVTITTKRYAEIQEE